MTILVSFSREIFFVLLQLFLALINDFGSRHTCVSVFTCESPVKIVDTTIDLILEVYLHIELKIMA